MRKLLLLFGLIGLLSLKVFAAGSPYTSTLAGGNWNDGATWGNASPGVAGIDYPNAGQTAAILGGAVVTIPAGYAASIANLTLPNISGTNLTIASTGSLSFTGTLTLGTLLSRGSCNVNGTLIVQQGATIAGAATTRLIIGSTGTYRHNYTTTAGVIYNAGWNAGSTLEFAGYTTNTATPAGLAQTFQNLNWNCAAQAADVYFDGTLATVSGNFDVTTTNSSFIFGLTTSAAATLAIGGNLTISSTGLLDMTGGTGNSTINLQGNLTINNNDGVLNGGPSGIATLNFNGPSVQTFSTGNVLSTNVRFTVKTGSTLNLGTSAVTGTGIFTLESGATMKVGSPDGLVTGTTLGNVRVSGTHSYAASGNIVYNGSVAQNLGNEWGTGGALNTVSVNLEIANSSVSGVTNNIIGSTNVVGSLTLTTGSLNIGNSNTLNIQSIFASTSGTIGGSSTSSLTFSGSGALGILSFASGTEFLNNLTVTRTGDVKLGSNLTVSGTIALTNGNLDFSGFTLTMNGGSISSSATGLKSNSTSNLIFGGSTFSGSVPFSGAGNQLNNLTISTPGGAFTWNSAVTINTALTLTAGALTHTSGLTMATGSTVFKGGGSISGSVLGAVTSYNVNYTGTGSTGLELPTTATALNNLTINSSGTVTLATNNITINGTALFSGGTFSAGSNNLFMKGSTWTISGGLFSAGTGTVTFSGATTVAGAAAFNNVTVTTGNSLTLPSGTISIVGNLVNDGTLTPGTGTVTFAGTTTISGASTSSFNNLTITGTLTAPAGSINVAGIWTNNAGTFTAGTGTVVFNGNSTIGGSTATNFNSITISGTGTLTSPATLNVGKDFTNNGTFNRGTGTVVFNGSATQSISGTSITDFNNITVSNPVSSPAVQVQSNQNLRGVLTLSGTTTAFDADGSVGTSIFKLMSSADNPTQDASIATLPTGTSVTGNVTMQRYMAIEGNGNRIYRYISSPVSSAPVSQIQAFIPVTGTFTGASSCSGCGTSQSMFSYDETVITGNLNTGYINFPAANNAETFVSGRGYSLYVRGDIAPVLTAGSALWELNGPINAGNTTLPVSFTSSGTLANDGWNLVGNPFPATIDWNAVGWTKTNINNATYMLDNGLATPVYATYIAGAGANGGSRYIAAGQAFFVKSDVAGPVLTATEAVKVAGTQTTFFRQATIPDMIRVTLRQGNTADESVIRFTTEATSKFDPQWDAYKLKNPVAFNLSSFTSDDKKLAINAMPALEACAVIKMDISNVNAGTFSLDFSDFNSFVNSVIKISLFDAFTNKTIDVRQRNSYVFEVTTDSASYGSSRFSLSFGNGLAPITALGNSSCSKGTVTIKASGASEGNYRWYQNATIGSPIAGATGSTFTTPIIDMTTTYYVAPANTSGCLGQRIPVVATVITLEPVTISEFGSALKSSYAQGNQWYFNGKLIPGATNQTLEPQQSGAYLVQITSANCITFAEREFVITGLEDNLPSNITIYPNPTSGSISVAVKSSNEVNAKLVSLMGITLQDKLLEGTSVKRGAFNLEEQAEGMYILIVQDGSQVYKTRIIKKR